MSGGGNIIDGMLADYQKQVLRWNDQINLVSRQDTPGRLDGLVRQCRGAWDSLIASGAAGLGGASSLWYFDLGSGAGLPGIVWHTQMVAAEIRAMTRLVEPREKRSWFLERVARLMEPDSPQVMTGRWGEVGEDGMSDPATEPSPSHVLISLKALKLTDSAVLEGLTPFLGTAGGDAGQEGSTMNLLIVRFYPPNQVWSKKLAVDLGIPSAGRSLSKGSHLFLGQGGSVLSPATPRGAGLVLSEYRIRVT